MNISELRDWLSLEISKGNGKKPLYLYIDGAEESGRAIRLNVYDAQKDTPYTKGDQAWDQSIDHKVQFPILVLEGAL